MNTKTAGAVLTVLILFCRSGDPAQAKVSKTEGTKMTQAGLKVEVKLAGMRPGRPPLKRAQIDVVLRNPPGDARWFLLPKDVGGSAKKTGVNVLEVYALSGTGKAVVGRFLGTGGFQAVRLLGGAEVRLRHLPLSIWGEPGAKGSVPLQVQVARDITIGGEPVSAWFGDDPTSTAGADGSEDGAHIIHTRKSEDGKEVPVALTDEQTIQVELSLVPQ